MHGAEHGADAVGHPAPQEVNEALALALADHFEELVLRLRALARRDRKLGSDLELAEQAALAYRIAQRLKRDGAGATLEACAPLGVPDPAFATAQAVPIVEPTPVSKAAAPVPAPGPTRPRASMPALAPLRWRPAS